MRGTSNIPKGGIGSTTSSEPTAEAKEKSDIGTEPYKRLKTRKPPSVREKERTKMQIAISLGLRIKPALIEKDLNQLEIVIKGCEKNNFRFDQPPLFNIPVIKDFIKTGIIEVITFNKDTVSDQAEDLLIRMIRLGLSPNSQDKFENSVLMHACKTGRVALVKFLLTQCPDLEKHKLNIFGENAAMMAYKFQNAHLYPLLEKAGISPHPINPALYHYINTFQSEGDRLTDSFRELYEEWFEENNYMNLPDMNSQTLLMHAVINEDVDFVSFLCEQRYFLNVALHDKNQKSVFDFIKQIKDPIKKNQIANLILSHSKSMLWLSDLAVYKKLTKNM
jgi:hypothetical protein